MRTRRTIQTLVCVALVAGCVVGGLMYRHHHRYKHLAVHEDGVMYRSAWLDADVMSEVIETHQFRSVVNLCEPGEMGEDRWVRERDAVRNAGARLIELPMPTTVNSDDPAIAKHLEVLRDPDNYPMLVHCQHGVTRTAKFLSIYDIVFRGMSAEDSLSAQPLFGRDDHNVHVKAFVRNFEKEHRQLYPQVAAEELNIIRN